jgi:hypothetical protein
MRGQLFCVGSLEGSLDGRLEPDGELDGWLEGAMEGELEGWFDGTLVPALVAGDGDGRLARGAAVGAGAVLIIVVILLLLLAGVRHFPPIAFPRHIALLALPMSSREAPSLAAERDGAQARKRREQATFKTLASGIAARGVFWVGRGGDAVAVVAGLAWPAPASSGRCRPVQGARRTGDSPERRRERGCAGRRSVCPRCKFLDSATRVTFGESGGESGVELSLG